MLSSMMLDGSVEASSEPGENVMVMVSLGPNVFLDTMDTDRLIIYDIVLLVAGVILSIELAAVAPNNKLSVFCTTLP